MSKSATIIIRVTDEMKREIELAARSAGKTTTTFLTAAAMKEVRRMQRTATKEPTARARHSGVPTFFRAACDEAKRGGSWGYSKPGYHLAIHLDSQVPFDVERNEWRELGEQLVSRLADENLDAAYDWFCEHFPTAMRLVPARRSHQFTKGVVEAYEEGRIRF